MIATSFSRLVECATVASGNSIPAAVKAEKYSGVAAGTAYIGTKDVGFDGVIDYDNGIKIPAEDASAFRIARAGSVLVCAEGGSAGRKVGLLDRDVCYGNKLFCLSPLKGVDADYLYFFCRSPGFISQFRSLLTGVIGGVSKKKFETIKVPLPSADRQREIARKLRRFESKFVEISAVHQSSFGAAQALLETTLESEVGCFVADEQSTEQPLPDGWRVVRLDEISTKITDGVHHTPAYVDDGVPFVTVRNLTAGPGIDLENLKYITPQAHGEYCRRAKPEKGDILISKDGTIGVVRLIETDVEFSIFVSVAMVQLKDKGLSKYVSYALRAPSVQRQMTPKGAALKHLYLEDLRKIRIPLPAEHARIRLCGKFDRLNGAVDALAEIEEKKRETLEGLWDAVLRESFADETQEPARGIA